MSEFVSDLRVLKQLVLHRATGDSHQDRLESFYRHQAGDYDSFRSRLLHGRRKLIESLEFPEGGRWVDMGCGTGHNLEIAGSKASSLAEVHLVDLSPSLLKVAKQRTERMGAQNTFTHLADATRFELPSGSADVVTFSYSLTMIPDWFAAIENAIDLLKPGGVLGVADFYVSRKHAAKDGVQHGWWKRAFWQHWFAMDNVFLNGDHLAMLSRHLLPIHSAESVGKVPYLPWLKAPYYVFLGRK